MPPASPSASASPSAAASQSASTNPSALTSASATPHQSLAIEASLQGETYGFARERLRLPMGLEASFGWLRHPPTLMVVPRLADGRVLLLRRYRPAVEQRVLEFPNARLEAGETAGLAAARLLELLLGPGAGHASARSATNPGRQDGRGAGSGTGSGLSKGSFSDAESGTGTGPTIASPWEPLGQLRPNPGYSDEQMALGLVRLGAETVIEQYDSATGLLRGDDGSTAHLQIFEPAALDAALASGDEPLDGRTVTAWSLARIRW